MFEYDVYAKNIHVFTLQKYAANLLDSFGKYNIFAHRLW